MSAKAWSAPYAMELVLWPLPLSKTHPQQSKVTHHFVICIGNIPDIDRFVYELVCGGFSDEPLIISFTARKISARLKGLLSRRSPGSECAAFHCGVLAVTRHENHMEALASLLYAGS